MTRSKRREAAYSIARKIPRNSPAIPKSRCRPKLAIAIPHTSNSGHNRRSVLATARAGNTASAAPCRERCRHEEDHEELDGFDGLQGERPESEPQPRAVDFRAEEREQDEKQEREQ